MLGCLVAAVGCGTDPDPGREMATGDGSSSVGDDVDASSGEDDSSGEALDPIAEGCRDAFITDEEVADCDDALRDVNGDAIAILEACSALEFDHVRLGCMTNAARVNWEVTEFVQECVELTPAESAHQCIGAGADAAWDTTGLPTACARVFATADETYTCIVFTIGADQNVIDGVLGCIGHPEPLACVLDLT